MSNPTVYVVHCIDAEGPLYESVEATFSRLRHIFRVDLEPSRELLAKLQNGEVDLDGLEDQVRKVVDPGLLHYKETWTQIDEMLQEAMSDSFRHGLSDSTGGGWVYNWFCMDHVGYEINPRRRDIGYHNVFDHYSSVLTQSKTFRDGLHFHYHPHAFKEYAHFSATHWWASSNTLYQVLCRRIIDRNWFPAVNRPGFQVNRPDSHWFLEQFIPFDYASLAMEPTVDDDSQMDFSHGRSGDWRRAPRSWTPYHPSHDDYQLEGDCRRWIVRCMNVGTRSYLLNHDLVEQAFREASEKKPVVMAFADHDFRDFTADVANVQLMLREVANDYPGVEFKFSEAADAMRQAMNIPYQPPCRIDLDLSEIDDGTHVLTVTSDQPTFGPQPFLAIKTVTETYHHDNFDFQEPKRKWTYTFDRETFPLRAVESIGVATNNNYGATSIATINVRTSDVNLTYLNTGV